MLQNEHQTELPHVEFPELLRCLFEPKRYKVLWGGRGASRSWSVARALLLRGATESVRVLCARELQNSIAESVHKVLSEQINKLNLHKYYEIQRDRIISTINETEFIFMGIKNNPNKIRSTEGIDICWVEEANKVSKNSWTILIPTIRKRGSEIIITFNPELDTDYTYQRFVKDKGLRELTPVELADLGYSDSANGKIKVGDDSIVVKMTWKDNPWFTDSEMFSEMKKERERDYDSYLNVWEGYCLQNLEGAVYAKELRKCQDEGRICRVPYDRETPVDTYWDLGRADNTAIWFAQRVAMQHRVLAYYSATGEDITHFLRVLQERGYVYGTHHLPHDGKHKQLGYKHSIEQTLRKKYPEGVRVMPRQSRLDGINAARMLLSKCWFDEDETSDGLAALRHYRYRVIEGQLSNEPLHDWASDGADAFRTMAMALGSGDDTSRGGVLNKLKKSAQRWAESGAANLGWMQ